MSGQRLENVRGVDRIGEKLANVFTRKVEPRQVMTEGDLPQNFYRAAFSTISNSNVAEYVGSKADKNPRLSILEIGAGTCSTIFHVLERAPKQGRPFDSKEVFSTDFAPGFLAKAQEQFSQDSSIMEFITLDSRVELF
ncbi:uncharacterized protein RSE6_09272 [Rhynchosporium secalis]|uniref:Methyltransferase type 12 domain-containing protein n=1 Tax=Rhynchosporium secalis TaxID=38038 RepID=A0A1E1MHH4_RHYSE|nr:uncharacterized protein RSE6_09272 [Rhynchosporium secalis]